MERKEKYVRKENNINVNYKLYILNIILFGYINLYGSKWDNFHLKKGKGNGKTTVHKRWMNINDRGRIKIT